MLNQVLTIYLAGAAAILFIGTRLDREVPFAPILIAAFAWPLALPVMVLRSLGR